MTMITKAKTLLGAVLAAASLSVAQLAAAADVTGTWLMAVETQNGPGSPTFVLTQKGEELTGSYKGALGEAPVTGTVKGNAVTITYKVSGQGQELQIQYTGTVEGNTMTGKVSLGELGEGTFKGTKQ
jgi:hypothetical protein